MPTWFMMSWPWNWSFFVNFCTSLLKFSNFDLYFFYKSIAVINNCRLLRSRLHITVLQFVIHTTAWNKFSMNFQIISMNFQWNLADFRQPTATLCTVARQCRQSGWVLYLTLFTCWNLLICVKRRHLSLEWCSSSPTRPMLLLKDCISLVCNCSLCHSWTGVSK